MTTEAGPLLKHKSALSMHDLKIFQSWFSSSVSVDCVRIICTRGNIVYSSTNPFSVEGSTIAGCVSSYWKLHATDLLSLVVKPVVCFYPDKFSGFHPIIFLTPGKATELYSRKLDTNSRWRTKQWRNCYPKHSSNDTVTFPVLSRNIIAASSGEGIRMGSCQCVLSYVSLSLCGMSIRWSIRS